MTKHAVVKLEIETFVKKMLIICSFSAQVLLKLGHFTVIELAVCVDIETYFSGEG